MPHGRVISGPALRSQSSLTIGKIVLTLSRLPWRMDLADRFYCPETPVGDRAILEGDEARHLARVRRVGLGATVEIFDGRGSVYRGKSRPWDEIGSS